MYDLIIRNGTIVDGTGADARTGDVAVKDGKIVAVGGQIEGEAAEVVDAEGHAGHARLRRHPHPLRRPGHLGRRARPVRRPRRDHRRRRQLRRRLRPGATPARRSGSSSSWRASRTSPAPPWPRACPGTGRPSPSTSTCSSRRHFAIDIGTQIAHGAVRGYVMGERGAKNEPATPEDIEAMAAIVKEAIEAGAMGFSHLAHPRPPGHGRRAGPRHLRRRGRAVRHRPHAGRGGQGRVRARPPPPSTAWTATTPSTRSTGCGAWPPRPSARSASPSSSSTRRPELWRQLMDASLEAIEAGADLRPQVASRPFGLLTGLPDQPRLPEAARPTWRWPTCPLDELVVGPEGPGHQGRHPQRGRRPAGPRRPLRRHRDLPRDDDRQALRHGRHPRLRAHRRDRPSPASPRRPGRTSSTCSMTGCSTTTARAS